MPLRHSEPGEPKTKVSVPEVPHEALWTSSCFLLPTVPDEEVSTPWKNELRSEKCLVKSKLGDSVGDSIAESDAVGGEIGAEPVNKVA